MTRVRRLAPALAVAAAAMAAAPAPAAATDAPRASRPLVRSVYVTTVEPTGPPRRRLSAYARRLYGVIRLNRPPRAGWRLEFRFVAPDGRLAARWRTRTRRSDELVYARLPSRIYRGRPGRWRLRVTLHRLERGYGFRVRR